LLVGGGLIKIVAEMPAFACRPEKKDGLLFLRQVISLLKTGA
jgi:hypothetical protein